MTMLTRCPNCDTVFRVTPQQLQQQHGQVRCGRCMQVFDGFRTLSSEPDRSPGAQPAGRAAEAAAAPAPKAQAPAAMAQPAPAPGPTVSAVPAPAMSSDFLADDADTAAAVPVRAPSPHRLAWAVASAVLAVVLLAQAAYVYRVELAAHYPGLKPVLVQACETLNCTVPLPQQPKLITIEASDLQMPDAERPGVIQLTATLRSHAQYDVAYPALDLVLTNAQEHTLARRVFMPREYLGQGRDPALGIPPNAEVTVHLDLDTADLGASGFRLDLLPTPS